MTRIIILASLLALAGCNTSGFTSSFCDPDSGIKPIRTTAAERAALERETKEEILVVNSYGFANCPNNPDWKP